MHQHKHSKHCSEIFSRSPPQSHSFLLLGFESHRFVNPLTSYFLQVYVKQNFLIFSCTIETHLTNNKTLWQLSSQHAKAMHPKTFKNNFKTLCVIQLMPKNEATEYIKITWVLALILPSYYQSTSEDIPNRNKQKPAKYFASCTSRNMSSGQSHLDISPQPIYISLQTPWYLNMVSIAKLDHLWFNTFSTIWPQKTVNNMLKNNPLSLKDSAALLFITQFNLLICLWKHAAWAAALSGNYLLWLTAMKASINRISSYLIFWQTLKIFLQWTLPSRSEFKLHPPR